MRIFLLFTLTVLSITSYADEPACINTNNKNVVVNFLYKNVELLSCNANSPITERYNAKSCALYKACYQSKRPSEQVEKIDPKVLAETARRHGQYLLKKNLDDYLMYEQLKASIEVYNKDDKSLKTCPSKLELKSSDSCDLNIMKTVITEDQRKKYIEDSGEAFKKKHQIAGGYLGYNYEFENVLKSLKNNSTYNRSLNEPDYSSGNVTKEQLIEYYKKTDALSNQPNPFTNYLGSYEMVELLKKKNTFSNDAEFEKAFNNIILNNKKDDLEDVFCTGIDGGVPGKNLQNICDEVTRISKGKVQSIPDAPYLNDVSRMYLGELKDDLDISYARCSVFNLFDQKLEDLRNNVFEKITPVDSTDTREATEEDRAQQKDNLKVLEKTDIRYSNDIFNMSNSNVSTSNLSDIKPKDDSKVKIPDELKDISADLKPKDLEPLKIVPDSVTNAKTANDADTAKVDNNTASYIYRPVSRNNSNGNTLGSSGVGNLNSTGLLNPIYGGNNIGEIDTLSARNNASDLQAKLDEAKDKLAKLTAQVESSKTLEAKKSKQDEIDKLKAELEKVKVQQASQATLPIPTNNGSNFSSIATVPVQANNKTTIAPLTQSNDQQGAAALIAPSSVNPVTRAVPILSASTKVADVSTSASAVGGSRLVLKENIVEFPNTDLLNTRDNNPDILQYIADHPGVNSFPIQDKNKIVWTIIPSVDESGKIYYTAMKEKKVADKTKKKALRAPTSVKAEMGPPAPVKREFFLEKLNAIKPE